MKTIDLDSVVRDALGAARAHCLTGWALEHAAARGVIAELGPDRFGALVHEVSDAFRTIVWPVTRTTADPWWLNAVGTSRA